MQIIPELSLSSFLGTLWKVDWSAGLESCGLVLSIRAFVAAGRCQYQYREGSVVARSASFLLCKGKTVLSFTQNENFMYDLTESFIQSLYTVQGDIGGFGLIREPGWVPAKETRTGSDSRGLSVAVEEGGCGGRSLTMSHLSAVMFIHASLRLRNLKNKLENKMEGIGLKRTPMGIVLDALEQQEESISKLTDYISKVKE